MAGERPRAATSTDWGTGRYETFATELEPIAREVVASVTPRIGEPVLDVGCGTGNATLLLAQTGAAVAAVDPSTRLVDVARARLAAAGLPAEWHVGAAEELPFPTDRFPSVVSVFGVVFSDRPAHALDELLRVVGPDGVIVYTAWLPTGPIAAIGRTLRAAATEGGDPVVPAPGPTWHDPATIAPLVPGGEGAIRVHERVATFRAPTPEDWIATQERDHPLWIAAREAIADEVRWRGLMDRGAQTLAAASVGEFEMAVESPYRIVEIRPEPS